MESKQQVYESHQRVQQVHHGQNGLISFCLSLEPSTQRGAYLILWPDAVGCCRM